MDVFSLAYYKENECYNGMHISGRHYHARLLAALFITFMSAVCHDIRAQVADTVIMSAQANARIDFKVNLTDFDRDYHGNHSGLETLLSRVDSMVLTPGVSVERIVVVGTASPEGPYDNNVRLAEERAATFVSILRDRYSFPDSIYEISSIPEDWEGMRLLLVENGSTPYAEVVLRFLDETENMDADDRERRLKRLDGGRPYASLHDNVLPYLRRASVLVGYDTRKSIREQLINGLVPGLPELVPATVYLRKPETQGAVIQRERFVALKTNLLWDAALCANLGIEVELWPHWSIDVPVWYSPYDITERWRIRLLAIQPEVRWWPGAAGTGHYFGAHATVAGFNISTGGDYRYQDPNNAAFGLGVGYGYAFHLDKARRWGIEAQIGAGYVSYKWVKYRNTGRDGAEVSRGGGTYWGVTRAGVTLSYKFRLERNGRRWMKW